MSDSKAVGTYPWTYLNHICTVNVTHVGKCNQVVPIAMDHAARAVRPKSFHPNFCPRFMASVSSKALTNKSVSDRLNHLLDSLNTTKSMWAIAHLHKNAFRLKMIFLNFETCIDKRVVGREPLPDLGRHRPEDEDRRQVEVPHHGAAECPVVVVLPEIAWHGRV